MASSAVTNSSTWADRRRCDIVRPVARQTLPWSVFRAWYKLLKPELAAMVLLIGVGISRGADPFEWQSALPQSQGMSPERLEGIQERLAEKEKKAVLVIRNNRIRFG